MDDSTAGDGNGKFCGFNRFGRIILIFSGDFYRFFTHCKGCSRSSGIIQLNVTFIDSPTVELVRCVSHNGNLIALLGGVSGQRLGKGVIVDLDDSTAGDGNGKFCGFNRVRSFDVRRIAVAAIFVDDGNIVHTIRDVASANNVICHILGGIGSTAQIITGNFQGIASEFDMERRRLRNIYGKSIPRPSFGRIILRQKQADTSRSRGGYVNRASLFIVGQSSGTIGRNGKHGVIEEHTCVVYAAGSKLEYSIFRGRWLREDKLNEIIRRIFIECVAGFKNFYIGVLFTEFTIFGTIVVLVAENKAEIVISIDDNMTIRIIRLSFIVWGNIKIVADINEV